MDFCFINMTHLIFVYVGSCLYLVVMPRTYSYLRNEAI